MWLELSINLTLGLLETKLLANGDQWTADHAVIETHVVDSVCFAPTFVASVQGPYTRYEGQLRSRE